MKRIISMALAIIALLIPITANAETMTATFDFSVNSYGFPACPNVNEIGSKEYIISPETEITNNDISMVLAPSPFKAGTNYIVNWRSDLNALYYNNLSHFIIKVNESGSTISKVTLTFANGYHGGRSYFFNTWQNSTNNPRIDLSSNYALNNDIGTLDISSQSLAEIHWYCQTKAELHIKKIEVIYSLITSGVESVEESNKIIANNGVIRILGNPKSIQVYNISGSMISQGKNTINCQPGIYIVKVDEKARKVIVK